MEKLTEKELELLKEKGVIALEEGGTIEYLGLNFNHYQKLAQRTANKDLDKELRLAVASLGLIGEAGEVAEHVKKHLGHGHAFKKDYIEKELGDVLWYIAEIASMIDLDLDDIAIRNIEKLKKRYPEGFSEFDSVFRGDEE